MPFCRMSSSMGTPHSLTTGRPVTGVRKCLAHVDVVNVVDVIFAKCCMLQENSILTQSRVVVSTVSDP